MSTLIQAESDRERAENAQEFAEHDHQTMLAADTFVEFAEETDDPKERTRYCIAAAYGYWLADDFDRALDIAQTLLSQDPELRLNFLRFAPGFRILGDSVAAEIEEKKDSPNWQ